MLAAGREIVSDDEGGRDVEERRVFNDEAIVCKVRELTVCRCEVEETVVVGMADRERCFCVTQSECAHCGILFRVSVSEDGADASYGEILHRVEAHPDV